MGVVSEAILGLFRPLDMEISALRFLLVLTSSGLLAASNPRGRRELDANSNEKQDVYFMDSPGGWQMNNNEAPWSDWGDYSNLPGATNLVAYSHVEPPLEEVQPRFDHHLQIENVLLKIYDEVKMFELVELEPNTTENRCRDCCTPTPYDPKRPIMRREEGAWTRDQPLQNVSVTVGTEVVASSMEVNRTVLLRKSSHPGMDRCTHCCLLSVVQNVKRLDANDS